MITIVFLLFCLLTSFFLLFVYFSLDKKNVYKDLKGKHVVITGGSSGIGKAIAVEATKLGAHVTIISRDVDKLKSAVSEISGYSKHGQSIQYVSLDVTSDYNTIKNTLCDLEASVGPIFMLVNNAGMCVCGLLENSKPEDIQSMINLNYFGTVYPTKYVLPGMKKRNEGIIVFVSSEAAFIGIYGYSAYSGSKWAVRGLAESVFMELEGTNVSLTLAFPADTDTPGYKNENLTKPKETHLISGSAGLFSPEIVGKALLLDALRGKKYSVFGTSGKIMSILSCMSIESVSQVLLQIFTMGIIRAVVVCTIISFNKIVRDGLKEREKKESVKSK